VHSAQTQKVRPDRSLCRRCRYHSRVIPLAASVIASTSSLRAWQGVALTVEPVGGGPPVEVLCEEASGAGLSSHPLPPRLITCLPAQVNLSTAPGRWLIL
jgi:hypothetical protein